MSKINKLVLKCKNIRFLNVLIFCLLPLLTMFYILQDTVAIARAGIITTVAGGGNPAEGVGDGGLATEALIREPRDVFVDKDGSVFITDIDRTCNVDGKSGIIATVAGRGTAGGLGTDSPAIKATMNRINQLSKHHYASSDLQSEKTSNTKVLTPYGKLPMCFIKNQGQINTQVLFYTKSGNQSIYFTKEKIVFDFLRGRSLSDKKQDVPIEKHCVSVADNTTATKVAKKNEKLSNVSTDLPLERLVFSLKFEHVNKELLVAGENKQEGKVNHFRGGDKKRWQTNIPTYKGIVYKDVYKGTDLKVFGNGTAIEYEFIVKPGADPDVILLSYDGIDGLKINKYGELIIQTSFGKFKESRPYIYQMIDGRKIEVEGEFKIKEERKKTQVATFGSKLSIVNRMSTYGFQVASYNHEYPLIIDPTLMYSTFLGGSSDDWGIGIAVDDMNNVYVTGGTRSTNFPTENAIQESFNSNNLPDEFVEFDAFVTKLNASGDAILFSTYLGGAASDIGLGIAVDDMNNVYVTGNTSSVDFPTENASQGSFGGGGDAFVVKLNSFGDTLLFSSYLGGSRNDGGLGIAVDDMKNVYVTGTTRSTNFPTANAIQESFGGGTIFGGDAFITKLNASGDTLIFSTYLGGSLHDLGRAIAVDDVKNVYVVGSTDSTNFPVANAIQESFGGGGGNGVVLGDAFVTKLNGAGDTLLFSTYLGGSEFELGGGIALDNMNNAYVTGATGSTNFPTENAIQESFGGSDTGSGSVVLGDAFVTKLNESGDDLLFSTYLGGSGPDQCDGIALDNMNNVYVSGATISTDFPTTNAIQESFGGGSGSASSGDVFVTKLNVSGDTLLFSTYLGGSESELGGGIALDNMNNIYVVGSTGSTDFPTTNAIQESFGGSGLSFGDAFVTKITLDDTSTQSPTPTVAPTATPIQTPPPGKSFTFNCEHNLKNARLSRLERLTLVLGESENCTLKLTNHEPGKRVEISSLLRKGLRSSIKVELQGVLQIQMVNLRLL